MFSLCIIPYVFGNWTAYKAPKFGKWINKSSNFSDCRGFGSSVSLKRGSVLADSEKWINGDWLFETNVVNGIKSCTNHQSPSKTTTTNSQILSASH